MLPGILFLSTTSLEECEKRDVKGLYKKARNGEIKNFTGLDDPYEEPQNPEVIVKTENVSVGKSVESVLKQITKYL